jgi:pyruvate dehydrogenase E2 component (dihydrolipoyllysine-residue acetyltransferase)
MDVLMPQLGETVAEGKITTWFKAVGDRIKPGENLFEIETDKVSMEIQAIAGGVLAEIRVPVGQIAPVGAVVAVIGDGSGATAAAARPSQAAPVRASVAPIATAPARQPQPEARPRTVALDPFFEVRTPEGNYGPARLASGTVTTPLARRLAANAGIDLSRVVGSGPHGRIVGRDVEVAAAGGPAKVAAPALAGLSAAQVKALYQDTPYEEVPLDSLRRTIAQRLTQAKQTIPHFYLVADVEIDSLLNVREEANAAAPRDKEGKPSFKSSLNDFIIKGWAVALQLVPDANAVWAEDRILRFTHSDVAVAVAIGGGLITPVVRNAETKTIRSISTEMSDLAARARDRHLKPQEYQGGASAISNLGMYGVREFSAIINPPHATILAVGAVRRQPVERKDDVAFTSVLTVTLSCDHRVVDGVLGAKLLAAFKDLMENPVRMLT